MDDLQAIIDGMVGLVDLDNLRTDLGSTTSMVVSVVDSSGNILNEWDLMETFESGNWSTALDYVNETENVNATFIVFHPNVMSELLGNIDVVHEYWNENHDLIYPFLKQNTSFGAAEVKYWFPSTMGGFRAGGTNVFMNGVALLYILIGTISIVVRLREKKSGIVMFIKSFNSFYSILFGLLWILSAIPTHNLNKYWQGYLPTAEIAIITVVFLKVALVSSKFHSCLIYLFQNFMVYFPFEFREHRDKVCKMLKLTTICQFLLLIFLFIGWFGAGISRWSKNSQCPDILSSSSLWRMTWLFYTIAGYACALLLSISYLVGLVRAYGNYQGMSR